MAASAPFASPYRSICLAPQHLPERRTRYGKRLSDITLEGATFRMSFLNHDTVRETPKKQLQRIFTVPDSLARTANIPLVAVHQSLPLVAAEALGESLTGGGGRSQSRRPQSSNGVSRRSVSTSQSLHTQKQLRPLTAPNTTAPRGLVKQGESGTEPLDVSPPSGHHHGIKAPGHDSVAPDSRWPGSNSRAHRVRTSSAPAGGRTLRPMIIDPDVINFKSARFPVPKAPSRLPVPRGVTEGR